MGATKGINKSKYRNAVLYFVKHCNNNYLGATKLNKLIYYLDFLNYRDSDTSVTGDVYYNRQYGPMAENLDEILDDLQKKGDLTIDYDPFKENIKRKRYTAKTEPKMNVFNKREADLLKAICKEFKNYPTDKIVAQTHLEAPWFYSKPHQKIDYKRAYAIEMLSNDGE